MAAAPRTIEMDETQYNAQRNLVTLYEGMYANPKARELLTAAAKIVNPNIATPESDSKAEIRAEIAQRDEQLAALTKRMDDDAAAREIQERTREFNDGWNAKRNRLRQLGYTDDGVTAIENLAAERGLVDLEAAEALYSKLHPPASIAQPGGGYGGLDQFQASSQDDADFKALLESEGDNPTAERNMINKALTDFRSGR